MTDRPASDADTDDIGRRIERAAAELFVRDGFDGTRTADIARLAQTSKRSIYDRFPNKEALFASVMAYLCALPGDQTSDDETEAPNLEAQLRRVAMVLLVRFAQPETLRVLASAVALLPKTNAYVRMFWENGPGTAVNDLAPLLIEAREAGLVDFEDADAEARRFIMECCGPLVLESIFFHPKTFDVDELERRASRAVEKLLRVAA